MFVDQLTVCNWESGTESPLHTKSQAGLLPESHHITIYMHEYYRRSEDRKVLSLDDFKIYVINLLFRPKIEHEYRSDDNADADLSTISYAVSTEL
jgi:hypothetical protein